ncbi:MAG: hypothetical protein TECD_00402 [Hyphomicrobiaceae bacterium hypho_1]
MKRSYELGLRIEAHKRLVTEADTPKSKLNLAHEKTSSQGFKIALELVVGVGVGLYIGLSLDDYFNTSGPWFLIGCIIIGFVAGMSNVIRIAKRIQKEAHLQKNIACVDCNKNKVSKT